MSLVSRGGHPAGRHDSGDGRVLANPDAGVSEGVPPGRTEMPEGTIVRYDLLGVSASV
jgi:hypothetical protein